MEFSAKALCTFRACFKKRKFCFRSSEVVEITHYFHQYAQKVISTNIAQRLAIKQNLAEIIPGISTLNFKY